MTNIAAGTCGWREGLRRTSSVLRLGHRRGRIAIPISAGQKHVLIQRESSCRVTYTQAVSPPTGGCSSILKREYDGASYVRGFLAFSFFSMTNTYD